MADPVYGSLREKIAAETLARKADYVKFEAALKLAYLNGSSAASESVPTPMVVEQHANPLNDASPVVRAWHVPDGVCGFGWVTVTPGTSRFAKWLVKTGHARKAYGGGVSIWSKAQTQSLTRNEAWAGAVATVLRSELGVEARADSRID